MALEILSHRGLWHKEQEKNSMKSFKESFNNNFGIETDIRDHLGQLVISHDPPVKNPLPAESLFELYTKYDRQPFLALNIKSDGILPMLIKQLKKYNVVNYSFFDMSTPETMQYMNANVKFLSRLSEIEDHPILLKKSYGIWMDQFNGDWITTSVIEKYLSIDKIVIIVSPELHSRATYKSFWSMLKSESHLFRDGDLYLCTDFPKEAYQFFYGC